MCCGLKRTIAARVFRTHPGAKVTPFSTRIGWDDAADNSDSVEKRWKAFETDRELRLRADSKCGKLVHSLRLQSGLVAQQSQPQFSWYKHLLRIMLEWSLDRMLVSFEIVISRHDKVSHFRCCRCCRPRLAIWHRTSIDYIVHSDIFQVIVHPTVRA